MHGCDMVNIDWGVDEEDEIYQVPDVTFRNPIMAIRVLFDPILSQPSIH